MRKIDILNNKYEKIGLHTPIAELNNHTLREVFEGENAVLGIGKNLYNYAADKIGYYLDANGELASASTVNASDYIKIKPSTGYTLSKNGTFLGLTKWYYDINKIAVSVNYDALFTTPSDAHYLRFDFARAEHDNKLIQLEQGSASTTYESYKSTENNDTPPFINWFGQDYYGISTLTVEQMDYWFRVYNYLKNGIKETGYSYLSSGPSKYDVAYVNKTIDDPIAELNGHTLREVFEDGNKYLPYNESYQASVSTSGDVTTITQLGTPIGYSGRNYVNNLISKKLYVRSDITELTGQGRLYIVKSNPYAEIGVNLSIGKISFLLNDDTTGSSYLHLRTLLDGSINSYVKQKNTCIIDRDEFGISSLSLIDMDYYYSLYQARKNITKKVLTYADVFEDFQEITNSQFDLTGTSDYIKGNSSAVFENGIANVSITTSNFGYLAQVKHIISENYYAATKMAKLSGEISLFDFGLSSPNLISNPTSEWVSFSSLYTAVETFALIRGLGTSPFSFKADYFYLIPIKHFDESITKEQLDTMLNYYLSVKHIIIYPEAYTPIEPTGFGNRYIFNELNKKVYGHELNFENMSINLLFGLYRNAYDSFNLLMNFMIDNEAIISYNYGKGERYTDVRLINAPKTELEPGNIMRNKFDFKRITPFYTILQGSTVEVINTHDWKIKPIVEGTVNTNTVYIEAEDLLTTEILTVKFDFTSVTKPFNFYYNAETKQILINGINIGYKYIDLAYGKTFLELEKDIHYEVTTTGITNPVVTIKKWVID